LSIFFRQKQRLVIWSTTFFQISPYFAPMEKNMYTHPLLWLMLSLTLGLAPFFPEPHLFGKLRWVAGGAEGMGTMDWFDLLLHGFPWLGLLFSIGWWVGRRKKEEEQN
jgi:hypothetical protein